MKKRTRFAAAAFMAVGIGLGLAGWYTRPGRNAASQATTAAPPPGYGVPAGGTLIASSGSNQSSGKNSGGQLIDGTYRGDRVYAYYGYVQLQAEIANNAIKNVKVTEYPRHSGTSRRINSIALPYLVNEAIKMQSSRVYLISGATLTSRAFVQSLDTALKQAAAPAVAQG